MAGRVHGDGAAGYLLLLGLILAVFLPLFLALAGGLDQAVARLATYLGGVTFP